MNSIAAMNPASEPVTLINHENKAAFKRKINPRQATSGGIAFGVYLTRFGPRPEPGKQVRGCCSVGDLFGVCSVCVFVFSTV